MTITIEVDGKRVECQSEAEARKALAKAAREAKKIEKAREGLRAMAYLRAKAEAFRLLEAMQSVGEGQRYGWTVCRPDSATEYGRREWHRACRQEGEKHFVKVETDSGTGETYFYGHRVNTLLLNGAGFTVGAEVVDETTGESCWFTFGIEADEIVTQCLRDAMASHVNQMVAVLIARREELTPSSALS